MKNILFFLLILITLNNVIFASFPVSENQQREIELVTSESNELVDYERLNFYAWASFMLFILALCFLND